MLCHFKHNNNFKKEDYMEKCSSSLNVVETLVSVFKLPVSLEAEEKNVSSGALFRTKSIFSKTCKKSSF